MTTTAHGKQILRGGAELAQCASPEVAQAIVTAMNRPNTICAYITAQAEKRPGRGIKRMAAILVDAIGNGFDLPDEPALEGVMARYSDQENV